MQIIKRSSSVECLGVLSSRLFRTCLRYGIVLHPVWMGRENAPIKHVDMVGRQQDKNDFHVPPHIFWEANRRAIELWGKGFQVDRAASNTNAMPTNLNTRLQFNSRGPCPRSSGIDMLKQNWKHSINWCNGPFTQLLRAQRARTAIIVPQSSPAWWSNLTK